MQLLSFSKWLLLVCCCLNGRFCSGWFLTGPRPQVSNDIVTGVLPSSSDKERIHTDNLLVLQYTPTFFIVYIIFSCKQQQEWII